MLLYMISPDGCQSGGGHALLGLGKCVFDQLNIIQSSPLSTLVDGNELVKSTGGDIATIPAGSGYAGCAKAKNDMAATDKLAYLRYQRMK